MSENLLVLFSSLVVLLGRHYDRALRHVDSRVTQFTILAALAQTGSISATRLAHVLGMERTELTRNLKLIARHGLVLLSEGDDRRPLLAEISRSGRKKLNRAIPEWKRAQEALIGNLTPADTVFLFETLSKLDRSLKNV